MNINHIYMMQLGNLLNNVNSCQWVSMGTVLFDIKEKINIYLSKRTVPVGIYVSFFGKLNPKFPTFSNPPYSFALTIILTFSIFHWCSVFVDILVFSEFSSSELSLGNVSFSFFDFYIIYNISIILFLLIH